MKIHLTLAAALLLAACGSEEQAPSSAAPAQPQSESAPPAAAPTPAAAPEAAAETASPVELGRKAFNACAVCHSVDEGGAARVGPNLYGVYGQPAASREGFAYSSALSSAGLTWDDETLDAFIANPGALVRGNRMAYAGQRDAEKRANIIAFLKTLQADAN